MCEESVSNGNDRMELLYMNRSGVTFVENIDVLKSCLFSHNKVIISLAEFIMNAG